MMLNMIYIDRISSNLEPRALQRLILTLIELVSTIDSTYECAERIPSYIIDSIRSAALSIAYLCYSCCP